MGSRRWRALGALGVAAALLAGCADVPSAGAPHPVQQEHAGSPGTDLDRGYVRLLPPLPQPGYDAAAIMDGFEVAMADFTDDHAAARRYLTPSLARTWDADVRTVVYANLEPSTPPGAQPGTFDFAVTPVAVIARDHGFALDDVQETYSARVTRVRDGEWRLADVRPGTLISQAGFQRAFRSVDVYFPAARGGVLVPDHVFLPVAPSGLPLAMVRQLVAGPTAWLAPAVQRVVPRGAVVRSVVIGADGTAHVSISGASGMAGDQRRLLLAALTWTLVGQLADVKAVQLVVDGAFVGAGQATPQDFSSYDPGAFPSGGRATYVDGGHVQLLVGDGQNPEPGAQPALDGATDPVAPVAARGLAAVRRGASGDRLVLYDGGCWRP